MRFVTLVLFFAACGSPNTDHTGSQQDPDNTTDTEDSGTGEDMGDPATWSLEVDVNTSGEWIAGLPATVYRAGSNTVFMTGTVGQPMTTGEGSYRIMVGPHFFQSDPEHPYYRESEMTTDDGYPLIIVDYQRYTHGVAQVTVDQPLVEQLVGLYPVVGEGEYSIELHEFDYDPDDWDLKGGDNGTIYLDDSWIALRDVSEIVAVTHRNFGETMRSGDSIAWDGAQFTFTLEDPATEVVDIWREGIGNNDFGFTYVDRSRGVVTDVSCYYSWGAWYGSY